MPLRPGVVADAATAHLADVLAAEFRLDPGELKRIAQRQTEALRKAGFHVTVPVETLAAARRRTAGT